MCSSPLDKPDGSERYRPRVAIVNREFPSLTKTFHYNEYLQLEASGLLQLEAYALKRPAMFAAEAGELLRTTHYLPRVFSLSTLAAIVRALLRHPLRAVSATLGILLRARPGNREGGIIGGLAFALRGLQLSDALAASPPDIIHAQFATESATVALVAARMLRIPFSFAVHSPYTLYEQSNLLSYKIKHARFITAISRFARDRITSLCGGGVLSKTHVVRCGIDTTPLVPAGRPPEEPPVIMSVGSLIEVKGHHYLLNACAALRDRGVGFRCEIVGEGAYRAELESLAARLHLKDIVFLRGAMPNDQVRTLYARATVFALACCVAQNGSMDGIPVVLMEAMAAGIPCVSTRVSGIPELISDPDEGTLVDEKDSTALADAIESLLGDEELRRRIALAALAKVEREFNLTNTAAQLAELFRKNVSPERPLGEQTFVHCTAPESRLGSS